MAALDGFYDKHVGNCEGYVAAVRFEDDGVAYADLRRFDPCATGDLLVAPV
jgi:hypothetical protein